MSIEFSQIPACLNYPKNIQGKLSSLHSEVITYISKIYDGSHGLRTKTICLLNTITKYVIDDSPLPTSWTASKPFSGLALESDLYLRESLGDLYINPKNVNWDISIVESASSDVSSKVQEKPRASTMKVKTYQETDKSDLYIQPPVVPQFDVDSIWASAVIDGTKYCIYSSVPSVPTRQNEISVTTDVKLMTESQLMNLYPHNFIRTRSPSMYDIVPGCRFDDKLGLILPVQGFTDAELIDNIIKYPHLYKLSKLNGDEIISFYNTIEINGELQKISEVWKDLPDTSKIPYTADFVKEYVVRRYLLERDLHHVTHKYPMYGTLDPYLTLFSDPSDYIQWGYTDVVEIARQCVKSRVAYKRSRNPILRRMENNV